MVAIALKRFVDLVVEELAEIDVVATLVKGLTSGVVVALSPNGLACTPAPTIGPVGCGVVPLLN